MLYFVDLEASSLLPGGYPIEIAWVGENGQGESYLLRPELHWTEWSPEAEAVHGITPATLREHGVPCEAVARRVAEVLGHGQAIIVSDAPGWDGNWLAMLLETADTQVGIRLADVHQVYGEACRPLLDLAPPSDGPAREWTEGWVLVTARKIVAEAEAAEALRPGVRHRALPDAERLWRTWRAIGAEVQQRLAAEGRRWVADTKREKDE